MTHVMTIAKNLKVKTTQFTDNGDINTDMSGDIPSLCEDTTDCRGDSNLEDDESACCSYGNSGLFIKIIGSHLYQAQLSKKICKSREKTFVITSTELNFSDK